MDCSTYKRLRYGLQFSALRPKSGVFTSSVIDWPPEDHLAWFVCDAVEQIDLSPVIPEIESVSRPSQEK
jgi:hypothetical protein